MNVEKEIISIGSKRLKELDNISKTIFKDINTTIKSENLNVIECIYILALTLAVLLQSIGNQANFLFMEMFGYIITKFRNSNKNLN